MKRKLLEAFGACRARKSVIERPAEGGTILLTRSYTASGTRVASKSQKPETSIDNGQPPSPRLARKAKEKLADREFFFNLISSAATKRDAKAYISRLKSSNEDASKSSTIARSSDELQPRPYQPEVNLGTFFGHARAVEDNPVFKQGPAVESIEEDVGRTHVALVRLTSPDRLNNETLRGIGQTLSQLCRLSMVPFIVVDSTAGDSSWRKQLEIQIERLSNSIEHDSGTRTKHLDFLFETSGGEFMPTVTKRKYLLQPLKQERIPIISPIAFDIDAQKLVQIPADAAILALTKELAGLNVTTGAGEDHRQTTQRIQAVQNQISLDRLIVLDPVGGIPRFDSDGISHVFINLEQEYPGIYRDLQRQLKPQEQESSLSHGSKRLDGDSEVLKPTPTDRASEVKVATPADRSSEKPSTGMSQDDTQQHLRNLEFLRQALTLLPPSSSAIITTPFEAANSGNEPSSMSQLPLVGTRRSKNPLIHNLLTDKPAQSSSLPRGRLSYPPVSTTTTTTTTTPNNASNSNPPSPPSPLTSTSILTSTFLKRGMPLTIIPPLPWSPTGPRLSLTSPAVNLSRLIHLIEDSFSRPLNTTHYLDRIRPILAGLIIAGDYEGGAVCTWEPPPPEHPSSSPPGSISLGEERPPVPYLDKFAVRRRSQGAGGVADTVFNALTRACFPQGVCWRSRADNPVNRWYFERARGTWRLGDQWTMFWTGSLGERGDGGTGGRERLGDYERVCRGVKASWADGSGGKGQRADD